MLSTFLLLTLLAQAAPSGAASPPARGYVPERVYDTRRGAFADFEVMLADLAGADVVFVGEQHDDPNTHSLEHAMLDGLRRRRVTAVVSLEMFERDVQGGLDQYLAGTIPEADFLKSARPWPRYTTDYRPLVEFARTHGWSVVAANVPRRYAADVANGGRSALDALAEADRAHVARDLQCPRDGYFARFLEAMTGHSETRPAATEKAAADKPAADKPAAADKTAATAKPAPAEKPAAGAKAPARMDDAKIERYYWSQCVKDETMAESIAAAVERRAAQGPIVHFTGSFHSDFGAGTVERARRRLAGRRTAIVSILPVANLDTVSPSADDLKRADFLVYTVK